MEMGGDKKTLVEQSNFIPSTGVKSMDSNVDSLYKERHELLENAKQSIGEIKAESYQPSVTMVDTKEKTTQDGNYNIDTSFNPDTSINTDQSMNKLRSALGVGGAGNPTDEKKAAYDRLWKLQDSIRKANLDSYATRQERHASSISENMTKGNDYGIFGTPTKVGLNEMYDFISKGDVGLPKYDWYMPGIKNEEVHARLQSTSDKVWNGLAKFGTKTMLYGVGGVAGTVNAIGTLLKTGSLSASFNNDFTKWLDDQDERINHQFAHYYTQEEKNMNLLKSMGTANFWFNDVVGSGMSFTAGALLSAWMTGGMGAASLGAAGAKMAMKSAMRKSAMQIAKGATKASFSTLKKSAMSGRRLGNAATIGINTAVGAGWEASVEANGFMKEAEQNYREFYKTRYGKDASPEEMVKFRESTLNTANTVFLANMGIVGLSNMMMFGKYMGLDSQFASRAFAHFKGGNRLSGVGSTKFQPYSNAKRWVNKNLLGMGVKQAESGALETVKANMFQKGIVNTWNVLKRPMSEGVWEEGMQGVATRMANDYVRSKYDPTYLKATTDLIELFGRAVGEQYTSKEGLKEVGIGALIGGMFGIKSGFGLTERKNKVKETNALVEQYNKLNPFGTETTRSVLSNMSDISSMIFNPNAEMYSKFYLADKLGVLNSDREAFADMVKNLDSAELAAEMNTTEDAIEDYKRRIVEDYDKNLNNYRQATEFADAITENTKYSASIYRDSIANTVFQGLDAANEMNSLAQDISNYVFNNSLYGDLNIVSQLSDKAINKSWELRNIKQRAEELSREIEELGTRQGRVVEGTDTEAENIKAKAEELEKLNKEYADGLTELQGLTSESFSANEIIGNTQDLIEGTRITPEMVLAAYDSVEVLNNYITRSPDTEQSKNLKKLLTEYQSQVLKYKAIRSYMAHMTDKRFMADSFVGVSKFFNTGFMSGVAETWGRVKHMDYASKTAKQAKKEVFDAAGFDQLQESDRMDISEAVISKDNEIDEALKNGQISEDEAFTLKVFNHMSDPLIHKEGDVISDERYNAIMESDSLFGTQETLGEVQNIASMIWSGNQDKMSPRQREIYDKFKDDVDSIVDSLGDSPISVINDLMATMDKFTTTDIKQQNHNVINVAKRSLSEEDQAKLDQAIDDYVVESNKRDDGEAYDGTKLYKAEHDIYDLSQQANIEDLIPFIEQNRMLDRKISVTPTANDFGTSESDINDIINEVDNETKPDEKSNKNMAQNPEMLVAVVKNDNGKKVYEFSNLVADKFAVKLQFPGFNVSTHEETIGKAEYLVIEFGSNKVMLKKLPAHNRFAISEDDVQKLNTYSNILIQGIGTSYTMVYQKNPDGSVLPFRTGVGYGVNESERIDQDALSRMNVKSKVDIIVDTNDSYNQKLISDYKAAVLSGDQKAIDKAKSALAANMVLKTLNPEGKLVSVVKAGSGKDTLDIRSRAAEAVIKDGDKSTEIKLGTYAVSQALPGRPVLNIVNGSVQNMPISEEGANNIVDIGFIEGENILLKDGSTASIYPFASKLKNKGRKIPVIVIKGKNGTNYVYPVSLKKTQDQEAKKWMDVIDTMLDPQYGNIDLKDLRELNTYMIKIGLDPSTYQISYMNPVEGLKKARTAIEQQTSYPNVEAWASDPRTVSEIAINDVEINMNLEGEFFIGPKIRIDYGKKVDESKKKSKKGGENLNVEDLLEENPDAASNVSSQHVLADTNEVPFETGNREPEVAAPKPSSARGYVERVKEISDRNPEYHNIFDYIGRKLAEGSLLFRRGGENDARKELGVPKNAPYKLFHGSGITVADFIDELRNSNEPVVVQWITGRSDEEIKTTLLNFLKAISYKPTGALNYSRMVNGMEAIRNWSTTTPEEIQKIEDYINDVVKESIPEGESIYDRISDSIDKNNPEGVIDSITESIPETDPKVKLEKAREIVEGVRNKFLESEDDKNKPEVNVLNRVIDELNNRLKGYGENKTAVQGRDIKNDSKGTDKGSEGIGEQGGAGKADGGNGLSEPKIKPESGYVISSVSALKWIYGGDNAYSSIDGEVTHIDDKILSRNGIRVGMGKGSLSKIGLKQAGGNWWYKFYMNTGLYDMYNIETGEAFRIKPNDGVKVTSSKFILSLSQSRRSIDNMEKSIGEGNESNTANESDYSDTGRELEKPC